MLGMNDDFFQIGGSSIKATLAVMHLNKLGYKISIKDIMTLGRMKEIARRMQIKTEDKNFENLKKIWIS